MATERSDEELVERALSGDEHAFGELHDRYRTPIHSTAYRIIQDPEAARDATQEIFVKIYRSLRSFDPRRARFSTWIYRLAANHAIDAWRSRRSRGESQLPEEASDVERRAREGILAEAIQSPYESLESRERVEEIRRCVDALPELQKKVFVLRYFQQLKLDEIAEAEDCNLGTVKTSLFRATQTIRRRLRRLGGRP
jgi:RNA polymerase sigma-70 factor (ECF subfamily)